MTNQVGGNGMTASYSVQREALDRNIMPTHNVICNHDGGYVFAVRIGTATFLINLRI